VLALLDQPVDDLPDPCRLPLALGAATPDCDLKWFTRIWMVVPLGVRTSYCGQSRLNTRPTASVASTFDRMDSMLTLARVMIATSIPRSSLPSTSIA
jgi:hypothetical protein